VLRDVNFFENEFPFLSISNIVARSVETENENAVSEESGVATEDRILEERGGAELELTQDVGTSREVHYDDDDESEPNNEESLG